MDSAIITKIQSDYEAKTCSSEQILIAMQDTFGYLGITKKHRYIDEPFEPAW